MDKNQLKELKEFIEEVKLPKVFYSKNLIELIDIHMIILSQVDLAVHNKKPKMAYVNVMDVEDEKIIEELAKNSAEVMDYYKKLKSTIGILKTLI